MGYRDLVEQVVSEDAAGNVTANDGNTSITYTPDGFVDAKSWFKRKSQLKKKWKLEVADDKVNGNYHVKIGEDVIVVPKQYFQHFNEKVINVIEKAELDLTPLLEEAQQEDLGQIYAELKAAIKGSILLQRAVTQTVIIANSWKSIFPSQIYLKLDKNTLIDLNNFDKATDILLEEIKKDYGLDVGELELLLEALKRGDALDQYAPFSRYQNLLGCRIKSNYEDVLLTLNLTVDMSFAPKEFIEIQTEDVEKLTGELTRYGNVKINKNLVYPRGWMFTPSVFTDLKKEIKDLK
jgi:hypothetical protein